MKDEANRYFSINNVDGTSNFKALGHNVPPMCIQNKMI